jgi:hypothetical protein
MTSAFSILKTYFSSPFSTLYHVNMSEIEFDTRGRRMEAVLQWHGQGILEKPVGVRLDDIPQEYAKTSGGRDYGKVTKQW